MSSALKARSCRLIRGATCVVGEDHSTFFLLFLDRGMSMPTRERWWSREMCDGQHPPALATIAFCVHPKPTERTTTALLRYRTPRELRYESHDVFCERAFNVRTRRTTPANTSLETDLTQWLFQRLASLPNTRSKGGQHRRSQHVTTKYHADAQNWIGPICGFFA